MFLKPEERVLPQTTVCKTVKSIMRLENYWYQGKIIDEQIGMEIQLISISAVR